jgi:O-antigen/teichoic acid export membrane protein
MLNLLVQQFRTGMGAMNVGLRQHMAQSTIFGQSILALLYRSTGAIATFAFGVVFARIMPIDEYGVVTSLMAFCFIAAMIGSLGQQTQLLRDVPKLLAEQDYATISNIASRRLAFMCCGSVAVTAVAALIFLAGHEKFAIFGRWQYATALLLIVPLALIEMQNAVGCALGSIHLAIGPKEVLWRLVTTIAGLAIFFFAGGKPLNAGLVLAIAVLSIWLLIAVQQRAVRHLMGNRPLFSLPAMFGRRAERLDFRASVPFWITTVAMWFSTVDIVVISVIVGPAAAAYYYAANRIALLLDFFMSAFAVPAAPCIAKLHSAGDRMRITRIASNAALLSAIAVLGGLVVLGLAGNLALRAFGDAFVRAHALLMLLGTGALGSAYLGIGTPALEMTGHQQAAMRIMAITVIGSLIAMILATEKFGVWGTATVVIVSALSRKAAMAMLMYSAEGIDVTATHAILERLKALRAQCRGRLKMRSPITKFTE